MWPNIFVQCIKNVTKYFCAMYYKCGQLFLYNVLKMWPIIFVQCIKMWPIILYNVMLWVAILLQLLMKKRI